MAQKISIIIPNYNGKDLLAKNLPEVIKNSPDCEIVIVDDASLDDSVSFVKKNFKKIKIISHIKNEGFAKTVNDGVDASSGNFVVLLNSDVAPKTNYLKKSLEKFAKDKDLFAVGFADLSHEDGKIVTRGRGGASFRRGFVSHFGLDPKSGETLWVSGGSGIFDKKKFLELGGFDSVFAPFYWEDIDLSFRAWQAGYKCYFELDSKVEHFHEEGAIRKSKAAFFIKAVSYKNQFIFVWKNISDPLFLVQHIVWFPYHKLRALLTFDWAFFVGFFWAISQIPAMMLDIKYLSSGSRMSDKEVISKFSSQGDLLK